ncbi:hypothetical protein McanCB56680_002194 [Microsporum canis]
MTSTTEAPSIGYDAWRNMGAIEPYSPEHYRILDFIQHINWGAVIEKCYNLSGGEPCTISDKYTLGRSNFVRQIKFRNGKRWVVRLRLPVPCVGNEDGNVIACFESLNYLRKETNIPVPETYYCDASLNNLVGAPYILMEYIHGTTAHTLRKAKGPNSYVLGSQLQDLNFRKELAMIQVTLATKKFDRIGRPRPAADGKSFEISASSSGLTFGSDIDYYKYITGEIIQDAARRTQASSQDTTVLLPALFNTLIARWSNHLGPFGMTITSLGAHNVLVNERFEVQALIDPEGLIAAPIEIQAQLPYSMGLQMEPPSYIALSPMDKLRINNIMERVKEYRSLLKDADRLIYGGNLRAADDVPLYRAVLSPAAVLYQGMVEYRTLGESLSNKWLVTYSNMARESRLPGPENQDSFPVSYVFEDSENEGY